MQNKNFNKWLDAFMDEKGIDLEEIKTIKGNIYSYGVIVEMMKNTSKTEQKVIKNQLVKIDLFNQNVTDFFDYLANELFEEVA